MVGETGRDMHRENGDFKNYSSFDRTGDGEGNSWRMFQRREKRIDEWQADRNSHRSDKRSSVEGDGLYEKASSRERNRYSASPEYERMKKLEKIWKEKTPPEKSSKDRDRLDHSSRDFSYRSRADHPSKDFGHRDRGDHFPKDLSRKDRVDYSHKNPGYDHLSKDRSDHFHKDLGYRDRRSTSVNDYNERSSNRNYFRDRDHQKYRRISDERERDLKMNDVQDRRNTLERTRVQTHDRSTSGNCNQGGVVEKKGFERPAEHRIKPQSENVFCHREGKFPVENRPTKLKLKVGGVTHTIHSDGRRQSDSGRSFEKGRSKPSGSTGPIVKKPSTSVPEPSRRRQRLILQENSDDEDEGAAPKAEEPILEPCRKDTDSVDVANVETNSDAQETHMEEIVSRVHSVAMPKPPEPKDTASPPLQAVRKSSRIPKKRVLDGDKDDETEPKRRRRRKVEQDSDEDQYQIEEEVDEDVACDDDFDSIFGERTTGKRRKRGRVDSDCVAGELKKDVPLTARQRSLQCSKEGGDADLGVSLIEFPEGLSHSFLKKKQEVISEADRQSKKEEAARKRRQQVEKAAKESQAVAIQKILGQDSQRKKREEKLQKQREELEQEKKAAAMEPPSNCIRIVMGPSGTVVSFSHDIEFPKIFSGPCSYPKEREICAAPSCNNTYKYRDSKSRLPLCSLQCYQAVQKLPHFASAH
eukprot:c28801_g1_i1 orf=643-2733(-)